jgi:YidC/Oxa1 family membrane protein insertase
VSALWNGILDALGQVLAFLYQVIPNYGVAIILLTLLIRLVLLPLGIKQVRSMQAMQAVQPKVKELQKKYKSDKQKLNEETMKLYREHGVNPLSGCLPLLAQLPVLIALFAVLRVTGGNISTHIPRDSELFTAIQTQDTYLLPGHQVNLLCTATQAGQQVQFDVPDPFEKNAPNYVGSGPNPRTLDCGSNVPDRIPYYLLAVAMIGTTFYQQRQMQRASPGGNPQQQMLTRIMPLLFGVWGFLFPAGLVVYWITTNLVQIGQQQFLLRQRRSRELALGDGKAPGAVSSKNAGSTPKGTPKGSASGKRPASGTRSSGGRAQPGKGTSGGRTGGSTGKPKGTGTAKGQSPSKGSRAGSGGSGGNGQRGSASGGTDPGGGDGSRKKRPNR